MNWMTCLAGPDAASLALYSSQALSIWLSFPWVVSAASLAASENFSLIAAAIFGRRSSAVRFPSAINLSSWAVVIPIASAAIWKAPGRASPSCPRMSSARTFPLDIIWPRAKKTRLISSPDSCMAAPASVKALKMSFTCGARLEFMPAAKNVLAASAPERNC